MGLNLYVQAPTCGIENQRTQVMSSALIGLSIGSGEYCYFRVMNLTPDEQPVVRRAVAAYHEAKKGSNR